MGSERCGCGSCGLNFTIFSKYIKDNANSAEEVNQYEKKRNHNTTEKTQSDDETKKNYNNPPKYEC